MSPSPALLNHIGQAEHHVRRARQLWSTRDSGCTACLGHLQSAVEEIHKAQRAVAKDVAVPLAKGRLLKLREDIRLMGRLIDAALAFYRGLALQAGMEEPAQSPAKG